MTNKKIKQLQRDMFRSDEFFSDEGLEYVRRYLAKAQAVPSYANELCEKGEMSDITFSLYAFMHMNSDENKIASFSIAQLAEANVCTEKEIKESLGELEQRRMIQKSDETAPLESCNFLMLPSEQFV